MINQNQQMQTTLSRLRKFVLILVIMSLLMLILQVFNSLLDYKLSFSLGLRPRHIDGLQGTIFSPWLHANWGHLASNLPSFLLLSILCLWHGIRRYIIGSALIILISGLLVWLVGRGDSVHVGASGWIFGLWGWLLASAVLHRKIKSFIAGVLTLILYSGMIWGVIPQNGISFEYHIAGIVAGVIVAFLAKPFPVLR